MMRDPAPSEAPRAETSVRIAGVSKSFGDIVAVDDVSLDIATGEFFALLGPSGCGKTTLLRLLAGLETPSDGAILIDGADVTRLPPYRRPVNMMFQSYALFPHMTVAGNIAFGLKQDRVPRRALRQRVDEALALVQLTELAERKPHQLSGGQRQRVALARSLVKEPRLLLLDEPLAALDKKLREETQFELMAIQRRVGITFVIVTHDQQEAMTMASRIAVMERGRIVQVGTPTQIYEAPACRYVAEFIGDVNIFEGHATRIEGDRVEIGSPDTGATLIATATPNGLTAGERVWLAVRPEKIVLSSEPNQGSWNGLTGEVAEVAYLGNASAYRVRLDNGRMITARRANADAGTARSDGRVHLSWPPDASILLRS